LPDGMSYRLLVLPHLEVMSLEVARKLRELVAAGTVVVGPKPIRCTGQQDDAELKRIADELWDGGKITMRSAKEALASLQVLPDIEGIPDWIHRRTADADIYFISSQQAQPARAELRFRVDGKQPELWDPITGEHRAATAFTRKDNRTTVSLELAPYGSLFVIFRQPATTNGMGHNFPTCTQVAEITGPWQVTFDSRWGGPASVQFDELVDWTLRPEEGIQFYSGTATYRKTFDRPAAKDRLLLDLGRVSMLAEVHLNGKNLGVVWAPPFRVDITGAVKATGNKLEVLVVNTWYNRLVKDLTLPEAQRLTKTNIRLKPGAKPAESGMLGPVTIQAATE
jgi:hypothetical protein